jgi:phytoene dehydrogenase-like protein
VRAYSPGDAGELADFLRRLHGHADTLRLLLEATPPRLDPEDRRNLLPLVPLAWAIRKRGRGPMRELLRIITMNVADLLEDHFDSDPVKGAFALDAVLGTDHGPRSPNTVFTLLHRLAGHATIGKGGAVVPAGGTVGIIEALNRAAAAAGVDVRTGSRVVRIAVEAGAVRGVELADGQTLEAPVVVSNADPVTTFQDLVGADHLDADFLSEVTHIRMRGTTGKVAYALDRLPALPGAAQGKPMRWLLAPSIDDVERAFDHVKYGEAAPEPALEITIPSLTNPACAPEGKHLMSVNVAYAPYAETFDANALAETVTHLIARHAPGLSAAVLAREAWGPGPVLHDTPRARVRTVPRPGERPLPLRRRDPPGRRRDRHQRLQRRARDPA